MSSEQQSSGQDAKCDMRTAIDRVVAQGPRFLQHEIDADQMAHLMVSAVADHEAQAEGKPDDSSPEARALTKVLHELKTCGSGYLAGRCDADCVARTIRWLVGEFAPS